MRAVIRVTDRDGVPMGSCSERCYAAERDTDCHCVCLGRNHGRGLEGALLGGAELAEHWERRGCSVSLHPGTRQMVLSPDWLQ